jgi:hypothetical protein
MQAGVDLRTCVRSRIADAATIDFAPRGRPELCRSKIIKRLSPEFVMAPARTDSKYWRDRGKEMRKIAEQTNDPQSKETMLEIAHDYELLACQFEYREKPPIQRGSARIGRTK